MTKSMITKRSRTFHAIRTQKTCADKTMMGKKCFRSLKSAMTSSSRYWGTDLNFKSLQYPMMFVPYGIPRGSSISCLIASCLADNGEVQGGYGVLCGKAWPTGPTMPKTEADAE